MKFQARQRKDGQWFIRIVGANGEIVAGSSGEGYKRRVDCVATIALIISADPATPIEIVPHKGERTITNDSTKPK